MQDPVIQWVASKFYERPLQPTELQVARKILYGVLIILLFTGSFFWRIYLVEARADQLGVREKNRGEVEISGSLIRLSLTGSRGLATCVLWMSAIDAQKKQQWNELEFYVNALTKLQPHFTTPWLFQSWNLSYNVAAESDRWSDKYFYITRGIQLLYRGERQNRNNPDMRFAVGFYTQHKICQSDETHVHRSLFQLSCIPPNERDPNRFIKTDPNGKTTIDWVQFQDFCEKHPQLVRRLRAAIRREGGSDDRVTLRLNESQFRCNSVEEVVTFLTENWRLPSLYQEPEGTAWDPQKQPVPARLGDRFPVLPPPRDARDMPAYQKLYEPSPGVKELTAGDKDTDSSPTELDDNVDGWAVARAWFGYAQEPLPEPDPDLPGENQPIKDRITQRIPKNMVTVLFRNQPCLAQSHQAQRLMQEGWFNTEPWTLDTWFDKRPMVNGERPPRPKLVLLRKDSAQQSWEKAYYMWLALGNANHLRFRDAEDEYSTKMRAKKYCDPRGILVGSRPPEPKGGPASLSAEDFRNYTAAVVIARQEMFARMCNFKHHLARADVEKEAATMQARFLFRQAERETQTNNTELALKTLNNDQAMKAWVEKVLLPHPFFRDDDLIQEQTVEYHLAYLDVLNDVYAQVVLDRIVEFDEKAAMNPFDKAIAVIREQDKGMFYRGGRLRLFTKTPFDREFIDDKDVPRAALLAFGSASNGGLPVLTALGTVRVTPLMDPKVLRRVMEDKKLIPRQQAPAPVPPAHGPVPAAARAN
jgi:hypothetical protein